MEISSLFYKDLFFINYEGRNKKDVLKKMSSEIVDRGYGTNEKAIYKAYVKREKEFSTGIGNSIAIPHVRINEIEKPAIAYIKLKETIKWGSLDGKNVQHVFMILMPNGEGANSDHLKALAELSRSFMKKEFQEAILKTNKVEDLKKIFK